MKKIVIGVMIMCCCSTLAFAEYGYGGKNHGRAFAGQDDEKEHGMRRGRNDRGFSQWLKKEMPELSEELDAMKKESPGLCRMFMKGFQSKPFHYMMRRKNISEDVKNTAKALFKNEFESLKLAKQYSETKDEAIKTQIKEVLNKSFELKEQLHLAMLKKMEERINSVKEMISKRQGLKDQIVNDRLTELISGDEEVMQW